MPPGFMNANCAPVEARCASAIRLPSVDSPAAFSVRRDRACATPTSRLTSGATRSSAAATIFADVRVGRETRALVAPGRDDRRGLRHDVVRLAADRQVDVVVGGARRERLRDQDRLAVLVRRRARW